MTAFRTLDDITPADLARAGGKAFNCARLRQAGFPVPDGLVVPSDASEEEIHLLQDDPWFDTLPPGTLFAVRSSGLGEDSAGHSFAGMHDTHLNVARNEVALAVLVCRRSAHSDQARAYRQARQLEGEEHIGVLVQRMVPAVTSGVAFTINPVTGVNELVINSVDGLGEALVSGRVTPEVSLLPKTDQRPLAQLIVAIERHYGTPQDVEWCHDGEQYWIVQSRPVTTRLRSHESRASVGAASQAPALRLRSHESSTSSGAASQPPAFARADSAPAIEWTRANLAEVLPDQLSPQALELYERALHSAERKFFGRLMAPDSELGPIIKSFHGRLYFNLSQLRRITSTVGASFADGLRSMGHAEQIQPEDEIVKRPPIADLARAVPHILKLVYYDLSAARIFREHEAMTERALARLTTVDPRTASDREIRAMFDWWLALVPDTLTAVFVMSSVQQRESFVRKACHAVGCSYERLVYPQLAAGERSVSTEQALDLVALTDVARREAQAMTYLAKNDGTFSDYRTALAGTKFLDAFDQFLERYGHRGRYESDWALPRLREDPAPVLFAIRSQLQGASQDVAALAERQAAESAAAWGEFEERLTAWQKWTLLPRVRAAIRRLKQQYVWRERVRSDLTRVLARVRVWHLALADRFVDREWLDRRDDYFLLHLDEVARACDDPSFGSELRPIAMRRAAQLAAERDLRMPLFMRESELPAMLRASDCDKTSGVRLQTDPCDADGLLTGLCVSPGSVDAEVVVMRDPSEFAAMKRGAILVTTATDPSWTPLFTLASGVIVEVGGMLSHASTIAREYGLPALANVKDATRRLKTGDRVTLDASGGVVRRNEN